MCKIKFTKDKMFVDGEMVKEYSKKANDNNDDIYDMWLLWHYIINKFVEDPLKFYENYKRNMNKLDNKKEAY